MVHGFVNSVRLYIHVTCTCIYTFLVLSYVHPWVPREVYSWVLSGAVEYSVYVFLCLEEGETVQASTVDSARSRSNPHLDYRDSHTPLGLKRNPKEYK